MSTSRLSSAEVNNFSNKEDAEETPVAYQLYMQSRQASEKVDEMISFLRTKEPISSCSQRMNTRRGPTGDRLKHSPPSAPRRDQDESKQTIEEAAKMLARARVEAMTGNLYYESVDEKKGNG